MRGSEAGTKALLLAGHIRRGVLLFVAADLAATLVKDARHIGSLAEEAKTLPRDRKDLYD
jgi:hypothetical protein